MSNDDQHLKIYKGKTNSFETLCANERTLLGMKAAWFSANAELVSGAKSVKEGTVLRVRSYSEKSFALSEELRGVTTVHIFDDGVLRVTVTKHAAKTAEADVMYPRESADDTILEQLRALRFAALLFESEIGDGAEFFGVV